MINYQRCMRMFALLSIALHVAVVHAGHPALVAKSIPAACGATVAGQNAFSVVSTNILGEGAQQSTRKTFAATNAPVSNLMPIDKRSALIKRQWDKSGFFYGKGPCCMNSVIG